MKILVLNCGSSSLKYQLIDMSNEQVLAKGLCERIGIEGSVLTHQKIGMDKTEIKKPMQDHSVAVELVLGALMDDNYGVIKSMDEVSAIGHRIVHGGMDFTESVAIDDNVISKMHELNDLAPLHIPANITGVEACKKVAKGKLNVAVFDTSFGMSLPEKAYLYATPYEYFTKYQLRRYGFHGTSHMFVTDRVINLANLDKNSAKVIVCHLGNGSSVSASIGGKCVDTSMGLTPVEGLIMGTRSGDIDAGALQYICKKENLNIDEMLNVLNKKSGVLGISGVSSDFRDIEKAANEGNHNAKIALDAFRYRVAKYVGAYTAAMNGVDCIAFTAGVGENDKLTRQIICDDYLSYLGIKIDKEANDVRGKETLISTKDSKVKVYLIPTNEELMIARETVRILNK